MLQAPITPPLQSPLQSTADINENFALPALLLAGGPYLLLETGALLLLEM